MNGDGRRDHMEKPLVGAVLCCTSIPPEQRTRYAEFATQMGAEHKLDLTSDVTHLLVGDSNTPKYQYVAREREDVKVLRPEWLEAVRESWMTGESFDLQALEDKFKLPVFAGLSVCVTGFDDLSFRAQLQKAIVDNGGAYRGDLTRTVTHLIASAPQGKKYQYAEQWEIRVVSLSWLKDSLDRGMVLDGSLYHPTLPVSEQGKGAWNREAKAHVQLGKRARDEKTIHEPPRKLRRTASAKLGSQSQDLWANIMGGGFDTGPEEPISLRTSQSLPALKPVILEPKSFITDIATEDGDLGLHQKQDRKSPDTLSRTQHGYFSAKRFFMSGFPSNKEPTMRRVLTGNGAIVLDTISDLNNSQYDQGHSFVVVPYDLPSMSIPSVISISPEPRIVTELWIERCLHSRLFLQPEEHPASMPLKRFPIDGFQGFSINSTGFEGIELLHVSKLVTLGGATYNEILKPGISVLLCKIPKANSDKQYHARTWNIPVVSDEWLWACLESGRLQAFDPFVIPSLQRVQRHVPDPVGERATNELPKTKTNGQTQPAEGTRAHGDARKLERTTSAQDPPNIRRRQELEHKQSRPGTDFYEDAESGAVHASAKSERDAQRPHKHTSHKRDSIAEPPSPRAEFDEGQPLQEITTNPPPKPRAPSPPKKKQPLFRTFDGSGSLSSTATGNDQSTVVPLPVLGNNLEHRAPQTESINGAIQDLLNMKSKARNTASSALEGQGKKGGLLSRALSNMSNSSREGSYVRPSRASSVDSMNTDGVGSVIGGDASQPGNNQNSTARSGSFTGRAKAKVNLEKATSIDLIDPGLYRDEFAEEEPTPPMTQLEYGEHEDAIRMREKLAEKRRNRSRQGQETAVTLKEDKRIKDDDAILGSGWGTGRRTRHKEKGPKGMVDF